MHFRLPEGNVHSQSMKGTEVTVPVTNTKDEQVSQLNPLHHQTLLRNETLSIRMRLMFTADATQKPRKSVYDGSGLSGSHSVHSYVASHLADHNNNAKLL